MSYQVFEQYAQQYDAWYDKEPGSTLFAMEVECLRPFLSQSSRPQVEIGVGSGRFAQALGIEYGIDPSPTLLRMAKARRIRVAQAIGEALPFRDNVFTGALIALTICFVSNPQKVLQEVWRVLQPEGRLVIGLVPKESLWAEFYIRQKTHPIYREARFFSKNQMENLLQLTGFEVLGYRSVLFQPPGQSRYNAEKPINNYDKTAGFLAIQCSK